MGECDRCEVFAQNHGLTDAVVVERQVGLAEEAAGNGLVDFAVAKKIDQGLHPATAISVMTSKDWPASVSTAAATRRAWS